MLIEGAWLHSLLSLPAVLYETSQSSNEAQHGMHTMFNQDPVLSSTRACTTYPRGITCVPAKCRLDGLACPAIVEPGRYVTVYDERALRTPGLCSCQPVLEQQGRPRSSPTIRTRLRIFHRHSGLLPGHELCTWVWDSKGGIRVYTACAEAMPMGGQSILLSLAPSVSFPPSLSLSLSPCATSPSRSL